MVGFKIMVGIVLSFALKDILALPKNLSFGAIVYYHLKKVYL